MSSQICLFRCLYLPSPSLPRLFSVSSSRVNRGEKRGKARRALAWITRGIHFTFQSLLLSLISRLSAHEMCEKRLLLPGISPSLCGQHTLNRKTKGRLTTSCYCLHFLALRSFLIPPQHQLPPHREGHKTSDSPHSRFWMLKSSIKSHVVCTQ